MQPLLCVYAQVHVLTPDQTVTLVCNATPDVVGGRRDLMTSFLSDVTSADVRVDLIQQCETDTQSADDVPIKLVTSLLDLSLARVLLWAVVE